MTTTIDIAKETIDDDSRASDRCQFSALVAKHQSGLRVFISRLGVANASIDDVAQEALLIAYQKFDDFEPGTSFGAWVRSIARNLIMNDRRKNQRRYEILNEIMTDAILTEDVFQRLADRDYDNHRRSALRHCLEKLPSESRDMMADRYQHGVQAKTIAEQLGIRADTVRHRLLAARRALRNCIAGHLSGGAK